jgi:Iap family predicted aminopeptidase
MLSQSGSKDLAMLSQSGSKDLKLYTMEKEDLPTKYKNYYLIEVDELIKVFDLRYSEIKKIKSYYYDYDYIYVYYRKINKRHYYNFHWKIFLHDDTVVEGCLKENGIYTSELVHFENQWKDNEEKIREVFAFASLSRSKVRNYNLDITNSITS